MVTKTKEAGHCIGQIDFICRNAMSGHLVFQWGMPMNPLLGILLLFGYEASQN